MNILIINCGSSSLKYQLINMKDEEVKAKGIAERIGITGSFFKHKAIHKDEIVIEHKMQNHVDAVRILVKSLTDSSHGVIKDVNEISAVGHRIVHGAEKFSSSVRIDDGVLEVIRECSHLAPIHNPANIMGIFACSWLIPDAPMVGVFDTAFHQTMPEYAYMYAIPYNDYKKYGLRKYGFHGTSHKYVSQVAAKLLNKPLDTLKLITCHLGNGSSVCAIKYGNSVDTSMGLTPLEGLVMGTRCGDIDPAIIAFLMEKKNMTNKQVTGYLNKESGILGISGVSSDFRDIINAAAEGNYRAQLAIDVFNYRVRKYIGSYAAAMCGVDAIVFTAGIGENNSTIRSLICKDLSFLGIEIDEHKNSLRGKAADISAENAPVRVLAVPTNEELMIARETMELIRTYS